MPNLHSQNSDDPFFVAVVPYLEFLRDLVTSTAECRPRDFAPGANSVAMAELAQESDYAAAWGTEPVDHVHSMAVLAAGAAEDHLVGLMKLLTGDPVPALSEAVLTRAVLEASAQAFWLLEPDIGVRLRIARGYTLTLYSLAEQAKLPEKLRPKNIQERRQRIKDSADQLRMKSFSTKGQPTSLEQRKPDVTSAVEALFSTEHLGSGIYKLLCAVAHATQYGVAQSLVPVEGQAVLAPGGIAALAIGPKQATNYLGIAAIGYSEVSERQAKFFGWDSDSRRSARLAALTAFRKAMTS